MIKFCCFLKKMQVVVIIIMLQNQKSYQPVNIIYIYNFMNTGKNNSEKLMCMLKLRSS